MLAGTRQGAAATGLAVAFGGGALREACLLYRGSLPPLGLSAASVAELALLGATLGGLAALRSLYRTTHERDRAEDLHWDSMETVRVMSELAGRPDADLPGKLRTVLELGAARFDLEEGIAWCEGGESGSEGEVLGLRAPTSNGQSDAARVARLLPRLREVCHATRPRVFVEQDGDPPVLFGVGVAVDAERRGALAFAGSGASEGRFTATDKDLLGLMAQWLATELERRARAATPAPAPALQRPAASVRRRAVGRDLNAAVERAEHALRRQLGADATLELALDPKLPPARAGRLSLSTLVASVVHAAASLAPTGRIHVETRQADASQGGDLMLCASVAGDAIDAAALERLYGEAEGAGAPRDGLPLARLERLLRGDGGDLSVAVETHQGAVLTAYLAPLARPSQASESRASAQPSR